MNKILKIIVIFLIVDAVVVAGYFGYKAFFAARSSSEPEKHEWVRIDESYIPRDYIEEFVMNDSIEKASLPVFIKNYGKDAQMLRRFRGRNFAGPNEAQIKMLFRNLEDWVLIDLKYKGKNDREVQRAILYIQEKGVWKVGDSGTVTE